MKKVIIFQLFLLSLMSCKKQEFTTIAEGKVLAINTNLPIADATVRLSLCDFSKSSGFGSGIPCTFVREVQTDKFGHYQFALDPQEALSYKVTVPINPNGTSFDVESTTAYISKYGGKSINDFRIKPFGWLKIHLKNTSPVDDNDEFVFTNLTLGTHKGKQDKIILAKTRGDSTYGQSLGYRVTKNKVQSFKYINFKTSSNDTTHLDVFY